ncbi:protein NDRG3-like isoform X1 [Perca fluviatilis]|uniref:protein NDRG3-like isoform X1 n=1 Tax=Perca fluviatilis TaxID=8168 RepID=UPI0019649D8A|nr:protein NDRG3-like isoform X1 [Perca fluviatilis]
MADCGGLPQVVQPGKLAEAFKYFVQGMSYIPHVVLNRLSSQSVPTVGMTRLVRSRTHSASSVGSTDGVRSRSSTTALPEGATGPTGATSPTLTAAGRTLQMTA